MGTPIENREPTAGERIAVQRQEDLLADYYTRVELAEALHVHVQSLARWAWLRKGPRQTRVGGRVLYHKDDVRAWMRQCAEEGVAR